MKIKKHIPNILSSLRLLSPIVLIPLIISGNYLFVGILLSCFFTTDALDGYLARKWHVESELGAKIDAIADKLMLASFLVPLTLINPLSIINLINEGLISATNVFRKATGGNPKTVQIGRVKMVAISLFTILSYLTKILVIPSIIYNLFFALTTLLQVCTLGKYINEAVLEKMNSKKIDVQKENDIKISKEDIKEFELEDKKDLNELQTLKMQKEELQQFRDELLNNNICEIENDNVNMDVKKYCKSKL